MFSILVIFIGLTIWVTPTYIKKLEEAESDFDKLLISTLISLQFFTLVRLFIQTF